MDTVRVINSFGKEKLNNAEHLGFHIYVQKYLGELSAAVYNCSEGDLEAYLAAQDAEREIIGRQTASILSPEITKSDAKRDKLLGYVFSLVDAGAKSPQAEQKRAAQELKLLLRPFRGISEKSLSEENALVRSMLSHLSEPKFTPLIATLHGLREGLTELEATNNKVFELMNLRTGNKPSRAESRKLRTDTDKCYSYIIQRFNATVVLNPNDELLHVMTSINNLIERTQELYNLRIGIKRANDRKKKIQEEEDTDLRIESN